jgi:hypothetical protein
MSFENARITAEEYERYQLATVDKKWPLSNCSSQWTIDRERNVHMRAVSRTVPLDIGPHNTFWLLFWKSAYVRFECQHVQHASKSNGWHNHQVLTMLEVPDQLSEFASEIVADIEEALKTYGTGGIHCIAQGFHLKLDVRA